MGKSKQNEEVRRKNEEISVGQAAAENEEGRMKKEEIPAGQAAAEKEVTVKADAKDFGGVRFEALKPIEKVEAYAEGESLLGLAVALLNIAKQKVDPEITAGNPIWHWSVSDDHCVFVFKDGRKVRVEL